MVKQIHEQSYTNGTILYEQNKVHTIPALYLIRTGHVTISTTKSSNNNTDNPQIETRTIGPGGYFGDDQLLFDTTKDTIPDDDNDIISFTPAYTVIAGLTDKADKTDKTTTTTDNDSVTCSVITLAALRTILDTRYVGQPIPTKIHQDSLIGHDIALSKLQRHTILGAGTFGMVFLVSRVNSMNERMTYALKVQSKYELCQDGQALAVISEKNIMAKLRHPFLIGLINTYHDDTFVYILLQLVQGGELYSYIHTKDSDCISENSARFYGACIADGLGYMHKQGYVYRDLKPENVLVDETGMCRNTLYKHITVLNTSFVVFCLIRPVYDYANIYIFASNICFNLLVFFIIYRSLCNY
jgi:hypothetical protein